MKKFILLFLCLLLLGGGGIGCYIYFIAPANAKSDEKQQSSNKNKDTNKNTQFVEMGRLILPIIGKSGVSQIVHMRVKIEVKDEKVAEKVKKLRPRIKDAYLQDMYGVLTRKASMRGGALKVKMISKRLKTITKKVMGKTSIHDVLIQSVHQRPS